MLHSRYLHIFYPLGSELKYRVSGGYWNNFECLYLCTRLSNLEILLTTNQSIWGIWFGISIVLIQDLLLKKKLVMIFTQILSHPEMLLRWLTPSVQIPGIIEWSCSLAPSDCTCEFTQPELCEKWRAIRKTSPKYSVSGRWKLILQNLVKISFPPKLMN